MKKSLKFQIALFFITLIALIIRLLVMQELFSLDPLSFDPPGYTDMETYFRLSKLVFYGKFNQSFYFQPFYYAVFLPVIYLFSNASIFPVLIVQSILGAATVWLVGMSSALIRSRRTGIISAILMTLSFFSIFYSGYLLIATLKAFIISALLFTFIVSLKKDKWYYWCGVGIIASSLSLTRANTILFLPVLLILSILYRYKKNVFPSLNSDKKNNIGEDCKNVSECEIGKTKIVANIAPALFIFILFILVQLPFIIHNSLIEGKLTPPATSGPVNLSIGNNPEATPAKLIYTITAKEWQHDAENISIPRRICNWIIESPLPVSELIFRKLLIFWDSGSCFDNMSNFERSKRCSSILTNIPFIPTSFFLVGCLVFIMISWRNILKNKKMILLLFMVLLYWGSVALFINLSRYRVAILPVMVIFTGIFIDKAINIIKNNKTKKVCYYILTIFIGLFIVYGAYPLYRYKCEKYVIAMIQPEGLKIELSSGTHYLDNGPKAMGSWVTLPLLPKNSITKEFAIKSEDIGKECEFQIRLRCVNRDKITLHLNGKVFVIIPDRDFMVLKFKTKVPSDGKFTIDNIKLEPGSVFVFCDLQRNFNRTFVNHRLIKGELVARLIVY